MSKALFGSGTNSDALMLVAMNIAKARLELTTLSGMCPQELRGIYEESMDLLDDTVRRLRDLAADAYNDAAR